MPESITELNEVEKIDVTSSKDVVVDIKKDSKKHIPIQLEWKDLTYNVKVKKGFFRKETKQILHPMSGYVAPGEFLAVMGPSGSGKTSLLNILAQRVKNSSGELLVNGQPMSKKFKSISAFVQQDDVLMGNLTVFEALRFAALLRLPTSMSYKEKMEVVNDVMKELGLEKCKNSKIGIPGVSKGISGGERKRLCICIEMITNPSILFLDEPTSGLDAKTALGVIQTLIRLAKKGITIVCTIHQPRSDIYQLFDRLLLLTEGKVAYFGKANEATAYFKSIGYPCPVEYNPADYLIDLVTLTTVDTAEGKKNKEEDQERINQIVEYANQKIKYEFPPVSDDLALKNQKIRKYSTNWLNECVVVFIRAFINIMRDRMLTFARLFQAVFMGLLVGLIYLQMDRNQESVQDRVGVIFFILVNQVMGAMFPVINVFPAEKSVFLRERGSKMYHVSSYYIGRTMAEVPLYMIAPTLFSVITYFMVGFQMKADKFFIFLFLMLLLTLVAQALGLLVSSAFPTQEIALVLTPIINVLLMLFGGFYINVNNIPVYFIWVYYISFFRYGFEALASNELTGLTFTCAEHQKIGGQCPIPNGEAMLARLGMESVNIWENVGILIAIFVALRILGYLALKYLQKPKV